MRATTQFEYEKQMQEYTEKRDRAMLEASVKVGDTVEYHHLGGMFFTVVVLKGILYMTKRGQPKVKATDGKNYGWHKGWQKASL
jgi:plastocyanin